MGNEELEVCDVLEDLGITYNHLHKEQYPSSDDCDNVYNAINLIKQQKSEIDELKGEIRDFINLRDKYLICASDDESSVGCAMDYSIENLRNLLEKSK